VVNNIGLRQAFAAEGMTVRSTNDGESCVHAVEQYVDRGLGMIEAIRRAYDDLHGEIVVIIAGGVVLRRVEDGERVEREPETITESMASVEKGGYPHFVLKEIREQPQVARELLHLLASSPHVSPNGGPHRAGAAPLPDRLRHQLPRLPAGRCLLGPAG
jgi:glucosamine--fructose-6-phosphate aminotransferase (isomerizing)